MSAAMPVAVITGGARGIGGTAAAILKDRGWKVHSLDRRPNPDPAIVSHICDVTSDNELRDRASEIGELDALVTCAGINLRPDDSRAEQLKLDAWHRTLAVNLTGVMLSVRAFRPSMRSDGAIVLLSSIAALRAMPLADAYTASKGALVALTRSWSVDYGRFGIRVNCICPGPTATEMMSGVMEAFSAGQQLQLPQQRMARPEEVANLIAFLVSPEASYISGAIIPVDGGAAAHSAGMPFPKRRV
ncbi:SDR family oxidoreductase [Mesorhizobium sp. B3-1-3]|uniref:SDR family NAD(P)-dependent oxidoreductase n=1 Tax=unclassified Mesorhizobium TaxID=325217 RepID=UPI00112A19A1|nr:MULTISPECIES: SDR family oxidoreductase [unclassified Mesorhizobium]TPI65579.1 SDR family oxidoreductase [Mesorhizobium sp. B3-1-3]TPI67243.1 SDR family oxidoreductase [Mesorhizobium sp. B3-1-8]